MVRAAVTIACGAALLLGGGILWGSAVVPADRDEAYYYGFRVLPLGPAFNGLPLIPVSVLEDGRLIGRPTHMSWYSYCSGPPSWPVAPTGAPDNSFVYEAGPFGVDRLKAEGLSPWWISKLGQVARVEDFAEVWDGAPVAWQTSAQPDGKFLPAMLLRVDPSLYPPDVAAEFAPYGFAAALASDTDFCCIVTYRATGAPLARYQGRDVIYGSCHDTRFDPRQIVRYETPPGRDGHVLEQENEPWGWWTRRWSP